ncbi:dTDP-4-dehydrorhamnose 3,5-epimerase [candidate division KSB1 bacterium]|nr:dTDP-4-dehydrorhamnose 3,5-epimerase [candidate division KSB1 bacterium]
MIFRETELPGAFIIKPELMEDERGFFARTWCQREFREHGLNPNLAQCNISYNRKKGTLRGMHFQLPPHEEAKCVRCTKGTIYDVIIDLRSDSDTFMQWIAVELSEQNRKTLYIPEGFAHGFQTLTDDTEIFYQMSEFYAPGSAGGIRWNDPQFNIDWKGEVSVISEKDKNLPDFDIKKLQ